MAIDAALGRLGNKSGVCTSSTRPTNPFEGQLIYETDTNRTLVYDNAAWVVIADNQVLSIDSANNSVGIGTTTPRTPLEIQGASSGSVDEVLLLAADGNAVAGSGARLHLSGGNATQRSAYVEGVNTSGSTNAHALTFGTSAAGNSPVERMRIDASGNVGIDDTTPSYKLDVNGDINSQTDMLVSGTSLPRGLVGGAKRTNNFSIADGVTETQSFNFTADPTRKYVAYAGISTYAASNNLYVDCYLILDGTTVARGYESITNANPRSNVFLMGQPQTGLSGTVTATLEMTSIGATAYINGNGTTQFTYLRVFDVGAA